MGVNSEKRSARGKRRETSGLPVRRAAVDILAGILRRGQSLDRAFAAVGENEPMARMEHRDRALIRLLVTTVLRRKGQILDVLGHFLEKPLPKRSGFAQEILLVAAAQILFLKTPPHAAINIAVEQCRMDRRAGHLGKLANAVLRRVSERGEEITGAQDAARLNTPKWLMDRWRETYGEAQAREIASAHLAATALDISVKSEPEIWAEKLGGTLLATGTVRLEHKGRIEDLPGYEQGEWWVQDVAASLPAKLLGDVRGKRVADLCAAPGGKTAMLVAMGANVTAVDNSKDRLKRLRENMDRLRLQVDIVEADIFKWQPGQMFDAILLDAPCSATGAIRRHPDIPHIKNPDDAVELSQLQHQMLKHSAKFLKPGGHLVFCTCSLEEMEGEAHLQKISEGTGELVFEVIDPAALGLPDEWFSARGYLRTLPGYLPMSSPVPGGMDGFFAAKFVKRTDVAS